MENLKLWNNNQDVDIKFTKKVNVPGKQPFTSIDTYELIRMATKEFGEYGKGFGIKSMVWKEQEFGETVLLTLDALFFFDGGEFPIRNSLKQVYKTKSGYLMVDEDAPKKIMTNTIAKALSYLGFGASAYLGMFEDDNYINEMLSGAIVVIQPMDVQKLLKGISYYESDKNKVLSTFGITHLKDLPQAKLNECESFIKEIGTKKKEDA